MQLRRGIAHIRMLHVGKRGDEHRNMTIVTLRIHIPNDDRLFPGHMDTQIGDGPENDDEWAVDQIISHAGSANDVVFKVQWKSGDITWLPGYQIKHLQALDEYLSLLEVTEIAQLPAGKGKPPWDDVQVFLGTISPYSPPLFLSSPSLPPIPTLLSTCSALPAIVASPWTQADNVIKTKC